MPQTNQEFIVNKIPVQLSQDKKLPTEFKILPIANLKTWVGEVDVTDEMAAAFVANFYQGVPHKERKLPIDEAHKDGKAPGWIHGLVHKPGDGVYATDIKWTKYGASLLEDENYSYISADFHTNYTDSTFGNEHGPVLRAVALTNKPMLEILPALFSQDAGKPPTSNNQPIQINFSQEGETMNLEEIRAKAATDLNDKGKQFLTDHASELTAEERTTFGIAEGEPAPAAPQEPATPTEPQVPAEPTVPSEPATPAAPEGQEAQLSQGNGKLIQLSQEKFSALEAAANAGAAAKVELDRNRMHKQAEGFVFSQTNHNGNFLPKSHDKLTNFMFSLSQKQLDAFKDLMAEAPKGLTQLTQEMGDGGSATSSGNLLNDLAMAKVSASVKTDTPIQFSQAVEEVIREKPELGKAEYGI